MNRNIKLVTQIIVCVTRFYSQPLYHFTSFLTTAADPSLPLVLLSKSSKSLDHMLRKEYTVYCFEILWIGHMLRYHTDGFSESPTTVSLLLC